MDDHAGQAGGITRRGALALGAAAGAATLGAGGVRASEALAAPRTLGLSVAPDAFGRGGRSEVLRAPARFVLLGLREPRALGTRAWVRTRRRRGPWGPWAELPHAADHAPDRDVAPRAGEPLWTGPADELQVRVAARPRRPLRLALVAVPPAASAAAAARSAQALAGAAQAGARPPIVPRSAWGASRVPPRDPPSYGSVEVAFVHHTENPNAYGPEDSAGIVLAIAKFHRDTRGWSDVGYNFLVDRFGTIFEGRAGGVEQPVIGAHAQGFNRFSTGISIIGSFMSVSAPSAAVDAVARLIGWKLPLHGAPVLGSHTVISGGGGASRYPYGARVALQRINGHRDANSTDCPGNRLYAQLPDLRRQAAARAGRPVVRPEVTLGARAAARYGSPVTFTGTVLAPDKTPQVGVTVRLEKQGAGSAWSTVATVRTEEDGTFRARLPWTRGGLVRAVALSAISLPVSVALVPVVSARTDAASLAAGGLVTVSGTVRPSAAVEVVAERRVRGRWRRVARRRVRASGAFSVRLRLRSPGRHRVTVRASIGGRAGRIDPLPVTVTPASGGAAPR